MVEDNKGDGTYDVRRGGLVRLLNVFDNKQGILGTKWSMSEVGTPQPHNFYKPRGLLDIINNNNIETSIKFILLWGIFFKSLSPTASSMV